MEVEFICRYPKEYTPEEQKDIDNQAKALMLFDSDLTLQDAKKKIEKEEPEQWSYGPWTMEMNNIAHFNQVDKFHTRIITHNGMSVIFKIDYNHFRAIKMISTGKLIQNYMEFLPPPMSKPKTKNK